MKTWNAKKNETDRKWVIVDAADKSLGRLSTQVAMILKGKHRPTFTPNVDTGDFVVIVNAEKITMTGNKWDAKKFYTRSRFFGSLKEVSAKEKHQEDPTFLLSEAIRGMLPKTKLGKAMFTKLKVYPGAEHPHAAQNPDALNLDI